MIVRALLTAVLLVGASTPAAAADRTALLLQQLDRCDPAQPQTYAPKLGVLIALADGRSAQELAAVLGERRGCTGYITYSGVGTDELVFVGALGSALGALLWVDDGWWRAAALPLGYTTGTSEVRRFGGARELLLPVYSGGSAGLVGLTAVRIAGASAAATWQFAPFGEIQTTKFIDEDHLLIEGRVTNEPLFKWGSHPSWPYGAQWLFERKGDSFVEIAERQSRDPYYLMTGFVGGWLARDPAVMGRFATPDAVAAALDIAQLDRRIDGLDLVGGRELFARELRSWQALPDSIRTTVAIGPVWGTFINYDAQTRTIHEVRLRFDRQDDGWMITAVQRVGPFLSMDQGLVP